MKKSTKTTKKRVTKSSPKKRNVALTTPKKATKKANPFTNADFIGMQGKDFKVQKIAKTNSGFKIQEKIVKRSATSEKQLREYLGK